MSINQIIDWLLNTPIEPGKAFAFVDQSSNLVYYFCGALVALVFVGLMSVWLDGLSVKAKRGIFIALVLVAAGAWQLTENWQAYLKFLGVKGIPPVHNSLTGR
jgi:hypothetical protein